MHSKYVTDIYERLLSDLYYTLPRNGHLALPGDLTTSLIGTGRLPYIEWLILNGPRVEKEILGYLETGDITLIKSDLHEDFVPLWNFFLAEESPQVLREIRQILLFSYKAEQEPTNEQLVQSQKDFEETDAMCAIWSAHHGGGHPSGTLASARRIVGAVIYRVNWGEVAPQHGPGGIYPSRLPHEKSCFTTFYRPIAEKYPYDKYFWCLPTWWDSIMVREEWRPLSESDDIIASLIAVPKDSRGPRLICVHPAEAIWIQQGQRKLLEDAIDRSPLTKGRINFTDQTVNGQLALKSSSDRKFVTLDLKEASDRISIDLVRTLFGEHVSSYLCATRANKIKLLDGRVIELQKYAPMGNATVFPVQSLCFWALVRAGIRARHGTDCDDIYVFGDDILFPVEYWSGAIYGLIQAGLVPNPNKTFGKGFFRESCGVDAYKGVDVTPLRLRKHSLLQLDGIESMLALAHKLRQRGYGATCQFIYDRCRSALKRKWGAFLPYSNSIQTAGLFELCENFGFSDLVKLGSRIRFRKRYHRHELKTLQLRAPVMRVRDGDWYHLLDSFHKIESKYSRPKKERWTAEDGYANLKEGIPIDGRLEYPVPYRNRLQYGWTVIER
jgi:hypothetical protein